MTTAFSRSDKPIALRAKAWSAARAQTDERLAGELAVGDLSRLATDAMRLAEVALASVAPRAIEKPETIGWQVPACKAGCHYCCRQQIHVTPPEVFALAEHIQTCWSTGRQRGLRSKLRRAAEKSRSLDHEAYFAADIPCPLLDGEGRCGAYTVRPLLCRAYNSLDVEACKLAVKNAHKPAYLRGIRANGTMHGIMDGAFGGLKESLLNAGLQAFHPNLVVALDQALSDPSLKKRWLAGNDAFR